MNASESFLGVEESLLGNFWVGPSSDQERAAEGIMQKLEIPLQLAQVLSRLGTSMETAEQYLDPKLRNLMPNPSSLKDMDKAVSRVIQAINKNQNIAIFADYDVDGASSAALLSTWLSEAGCKPYVYVPDRISEGYGPTIEAFKKLAKNHQLIICVDCGTLSHDPIQEVIQTTDVIVIDHHQSSETLPQALAIVNPNRQDETSTLTYLCATGVVFMFLVAINRALSKESKKPPELISKLDLVALATIADVVPIIELNRAFVKQGLKIMKLRNRVGLKVLADISHINSPLSVYHLGFILGPKINAGGRVGKANLGFLLLSTDSEPEAQILAKELDALNQERKNIESFVLEQALKQVEAQASNLPITWAYGDGWHPGVLGIVASRLKEKTNLPSFVISFDGQQGKGSGRSVPGIDLGSLVQRLVLEGLLEKGGGHSMAAGISISREQNEKALKRISSLIIDKFSQQDRRTEYFIDGLLTPKAAKIELIHLLEEVGPFGSGAPQPRYVFPDQTIYFTKRVGNDHLKVTFGDSSKNKLEAICFRAFSSTIGPTLEQNLGKKFHIAGCLEVNSWKGQQRVQVKLEDLSPSSEK